MILWAAAETQLKTRDISRKGAKHVLSPSKGPQSVVISTFAKLSNGEISPRSLASARDDGPWPVTWRSWRLGASNSPFSCTRAAGKFAQVSDRPSPVGLAKAAVAVARGQEPATEYPGEKCNKVRQR